MFNRIIKGIVTSQSEGENATCLQKIVSVDKKQKEFTEVMNEASKLYNNLLANSGYKFEDVSGIRFGPQYMFTAGAIDCYIIGGNAQNALTIRVKYDTISSTSNLENNGFIYTGNLSGLNPVYIVMAIKVENLMYLCVITNKGGGEIDPKTLFTDNNVSVFKGMCVHTKYPTIYVESAYNSPCSIFRLVRENENE